MDTFNGIVTFNCPLYRDFKHFFRDHNFFTLGIYIFNIVCAVKYRIHILIIIIKIVNSLQAYDASFYYTVILRKFFSFNLFFVHVCCIITLIFYRKFSSIQSSINILLLGRVKRTLRNFLCIFIFFVKFVRYGIYRDRPAEKGESLDVPLIGS